jgi:hypothetical protein
VEELQEFITGNPTVTKLVINQHRGQSSNNYFSETFGPLVTPLLADESVNLSIEPVEIYQRWLYQQEAETGEKVCV